MHLFLSSFFFLNDGQFSESMRKIMFSFEMVVCDFIYVKMKVYDDCGNPINVWSNAVEREMHAVSVPHQYN